MPNEMELALRKLRELQFGMISHALRCQGDTCEEDIAGEVNNIFDRVRGNRGDGAIFTSGDFKFMYELTLRRCCEIIDLKVDV